MGVVGGRVAVGWGVGVAVGGGGVGVPQASPMVMGRFKLAFRGLMLITVCF